MVRVALLQMTASAADQAANIVKGDAFCRRARESGADLALFPEMWNIGYTRYAGCPDDLRKMGAETPEQQQARAAWQARAISTGVNVGAMICFEREFPESARILMLRGAELVLVPNACEMEANRLGQLRARAFENMVGIALANYASPQANGHSVAFDGMAFEADGRYAVLTSSGGGPDEHLGQVSQ